MAKDDIKVPMGSDGIANKPNTERPIGSVSYGANFEHCDPDGGNKTCAPEGKKGGPF